MSAVRPPVNLKLRGEETRAFASKLAVGWVSDFQNHRIWNLLWKYSELKWESAIYVMITWPKKPQKELFADSEKLETTQLYIDVVRLAFCRGQISLRSVIHRACICICPYFAPAHPFSHSPTHLPTSHNWVSGFKFNLIWYPQFLGLEIFLEKYWSSKTYLLSQEYLIFGCIFPYSMLLSSQRWRCMIEIYE